MTYWLKHTLKQNTNDRLTIKEKPSQNTEHQYTIDALAQSKYSEDTLTPNDSLICSDLTTFGKI